jgi:predicted DCC family thiol-disulfide oxidoreductase YuxK
MAATVTPAPASPEALSQLPPRILFFDGVCSFCDGLVLWLIERDPNARLHFAPLQGHTAEVVRRAFPDHFPDDIDTIVYLHPGRGPGGPQISLRSAAAFDLGDEIGGPWKWVARLRWLPRFLTDLAYRLFAASRYRLFGKLDACDIPTPENRARLLP